MEITQKPFTRKKPDQLVYLELGSGNGGMLLSISEDGFRFRAVSPLRPNGLMPFAFSFDGNQRLQGIGEVEWLEDDGKSGGMRFVEVSPDFRSALEQWLALDSQRGSSGREATPAAAPALDTMEKIREELRRGYPQPPVKTSARTESQEDPNVSPPGYEPAAKKFSPEPRPQAAKPLRETAEHPESHATGNKSAEQTLEPTAGKEQERTDSRNTSPAPTAEREPRSQPPSQRERYSGDRSRPFEQRSKPFYPPPFTRSAETESPAATEASSAFLKKTAPSSAPVSGPAENSATRPAFSVPRRSVPVTTEPSRSREEAHASAETLRRPFRPEARSIAPDRPYIPPPVDESFEAAWERAKLTAPPESPHLSRAAAGSIIGVALAVILGALAFNFRQDIGELVIDVGQKISGGNHAAAPAPAVSASENKSESQTAADPSSPASATPSDKQDTSGSQTAPAQNTGSTNGTRGTQAADSATQHDVASGTARDANPAPQRHTTSNGTTSTPTSNGNGNPSSAGATSAGTSASTGNTAALIGTEPGSGQEEFIAAREMLKGDHRHRDLSKAVDLLWAGVRKGYVPAEVTLADLYRRGDGVEKNCDQAQVLLVAASKKGSPEARQLLELMAEQGCSE